MNQYFQQAQTLIAENSAALLSGTAVVGVVTTAVLTGRASIKAHQIIEEQKELDEKLNITEFDKKHAAKLIAPHFVAPVAAGVTTISAIVFSYRISASKSAALVAAYGISEKAFAEYKGKVVEKLGAKKDELVKDEVAKQQIADNPPPNRQTLIIADGEILCFDSFSGRYFKSSMEKIRRAENNINATIANHMYASLGDFYEQVGLNKSDISEQFGWRLTNPCSLSFSTQLTEDERPCLVLTFENPPHPEFDDLRD